MKYGILTLETLASACPEAAVDFLERLNAAVLDCKRGTSDKPRKVTLSLSITPRKTDRDDVVIVPQIGAKTPSKEHEGFFARATKNGQLHFDFVQEEE